MSQDLILHLHDDGVLDWTLIDRANARRLASGQFAADETPVLEDLDSVSRTLCLIPSEQVYFGRVQLAANSEREARQAAPFMIEDELAASLDETRVVPGARQEDGSRWVIAADAAIVDHWRARIDSVAMRPVYVVPDGVAIADPGAALTLYDRRGDVVYAYGDAAQTGETSRVGAVDSSFFGQVAQAMVSAAGQGQIAVSASLGLAGPNIMPLRAGGLAEAAAAIPTDRLAALPPLFGEGWLSTLDWGALTRAVRWSGILGAVLLVLAGGLVLAEASYYRFQTSRLAAASIAEFQAAVPDIQRSVIPAEAERILRGRIAGLGGGDASSFLQLAAALSELTRDNDRVHLESVRFDQARSELRVSAIYTDFADFDALSDRAETLGLELQDSGAREGGDGIEGEFVVRLQ